MRTLGEKREAVKSFLLKKGFYVNDGIKYGLDYLVYTEHPSVVHSKYGVAVHGGMSYQQLIMHQRMCCATNKILIVAFVDGASNIRLIRCERFPTHANELDDGQGPRIEGLSILPGDADALSGGVD